MSLKNIFSKPALAASMALTSLLTGCMEHSEELTPAQKTTIARIIDTSERNKAFLAGNQDQIDVVFYMNRTKKVLTTGACFATNPADAQELKEHTFFDVEPCKPFYKSAATPVLNSAITAKLNQFVTAYKGDTSVTPIFHTQKTRVIVDSTKDAYLPEFNLVCDVRPRYLDVKVDKDGVMEVYMEDNAGKESFTYISVDLSECKDATLQDNTFLSTRMKYLQSQKPW